MQQKSFFSHQEILNQKLREKGAAAGTQLHLQGN